MFTVYAIYNSARGKVYIGQTSDLPSRLQRHNQQLYSKRTSYSFRNSGKWELVYTEEFSSRAEALKREKQLKTAKGRLFIKNLLRPR